MKEKAESKLVVKLNEERKRRSQMECCRKV